MIFIPVHVTQKKSEKCLCSHHNNTDIPPFNKRQKVDIAKKQ